MMKYNFYIGRSNLAITIFIPQDCKNNCSFCTSKQSYLKDRCNFNEVIKQIKEINKIAVNEVVITGGEPFDNLEILDSIINEIEPTKRVYVNTTFCGDADSIIEYINNNVRISAINISRHFESIDRDAKLFNNIIDDVHIDRINKPVRINCIINETSNIKEIIDRWQSHNVRLTFRADYRYIDYSNLKNISNEVTNKIISIHDVKYIGHGGCDVCFDVEFLYKDQMYLSYHRGLEKSSIQLGNNIIINDIIIRQDGKIMYDWDGKTEGIEEMLLQFSKLVLVN